MIKIKCPYCRGDGFTIEVEIDCCWSFTDTGECCGRGEQKQYQKGCEYCNCNGFIELTEKFIIDTIKKFSLTVRCLPFETQTMFAAKDDEVLKDGFTEYFWKPDDEYFKNVSINWESRKTQFYSRFPNGRRFFKETKKVDKGGWWYVKETKNTHSTIVFNRQNDKFFAPTLEQAIELFFKSK